MRMLIVVGGVPHPTEGASSVLYFHYIDELRRAGSDILNLVLLQPDNSDADRLSEYRRRMNEGDGFSIITSSSRQFVRTSRFFHAFDHAALSPVRPTIEDFQPEVTLCFDFASAWAIGGWNVGRRVVWLGDLNFETFLYHALYDWREGTLSTLNLALAFWRGFLWKRLYARVLGCFDRIIVSSKSSEARLAPLNLRGEYLPYPWPAPRSRASIAPKAAIPTFFFFGSLQGLGSRSALRLITGPIYAGLLEIFGSNGFEIRISGRSELPRQVLDILADKSEFRYLGFVDDLASVMAPCHAALIPIDVPVGNRSRVLTALSMSLPVVAHTNTALGNPGLIDGETCYLAASPTDFVARLRLAVERPDEAAAVAARGLDLYRTQFAPNTAAGELIRVLNETMVSLPRPIMN